MTFFLFVFLLKDSLYIGSRYLMLSNVCGWFLGVSQNLFSKEKIGSEDETKSAHSSMVSYEDRINDTVW